MSWDSDPDGLRDYVDEGGELAGIIFLVFAFVAMAVGGVMIESDVGVIGALVTIVIGIVLIAVVVAVGLAIWAILAAIVGYLQTDFHDDLERWSGRE